MSSGANSSKRRGFGFRGMVFGLSLSTAVGPSLPVAFAADAPAVATAPPFTPTPLQPSLGDFLTGTPMATNCQILGLDPLLRPPFAGAPLSDPKGLAAKIRAQELDAKNRIKAAKYLGTVDCVKFPEAKKMLVKMMLEDPFEPVRYEAARALVVMMGRGKSPRDQRQLRHGRAVRYDTCEGCCNEEVLKALAKVAYEMNDHGCCVEPSKRVRDAALAAIRACGCEDMCMQYAQEECPPVPPAPTPETKEPQPLKETKPTKERKPEIHLPPPKTEPTLPRPSGESPRPRSVEPTLPRPQSNLVPPPPGPIEVAPPPPAPGVPIEPKKSAENESPNDEPSRASEPGRSVTSTSMSESTSDIEPLPPFAALNGYCIVALQSRQVIKADPKIESVYKHRVYQFSSQGAKLDFDRFPESYSIQMNGTDPIELSRTGVTVEGQFLREYKGRFYLFVSKKSWETFKAEASQAENRVAAAVHAETSASGPAIVAPSVSQSGPTTAKGDLAVSLPVTSETKALSAPLTVPPTTIPLPQIGSIAASPAPLHSAQAIAPKAAARSEDSKVGPSLPTPSMGDGHQIVTRRAAETPARPAQRSAVAPPLPPASSEILSPFPELQGYCIVALRHGKFLKADSKFESVYNKRAYQFCSRSAQQEFDRSPESYCIQFDGADPVELQKMGIATRGQYLRYYQGHYYLFATKKNFEAFKAEASQKEAHVAASIYTQTVALGPAAPVPPISELCRTNSQRETGPSYVTSAAAMPKSASTALASLSIPLASSTSVPASLTGLRPAQATILPAPWVTADSVLTHPGLTNSTRDAQQPSLSCSASTPAPSVQRGNSAMSSSKTLTTTRAVAKCDTLPPFAELEGCCIVELKYGKFLKANAKFESVYKHRLYQFSSEDAKREFDRSPQVYAIQFDGADPLELQMTGIAKQGHYFHLCHGRYYLFASAENYRRFRFGNLMSEKAVDTVGYDKHQSQVVTAPEAATTQRELPGQQSRVVEKNGSIYSQSPMHESAAGADEQSGKIRISD